MIGTAPLKCSSLVKGQGKGKGQCRSKKNYLQERGAGSESMLLRK